MPNSQDSEAIIKFFKYMRYMKELSEKPIGTTTNSTRLFVSEINDLSRGCIEDRKMLTGTIFNLLIKNKNLIPIDCMSNLIEPSNFISPIASFTASLPDTFFRIQEFRDIALCIDIYYLSGRILKDALQTPPIIKPNDFIELKILISRLDTDFCLGNIFAKTTQRYKAAMHDLSSRGGSAYNISMLINSFIAESCQDGTKKTAKELWQELTKYTEENPYITVIRNFKLYIENDLLIAKYTHKDKEIKNSRTFKTFSNYYSNFSKKR